MGFKRDEIQRFLSECDARGEHVSGIAFQETWMIDGDELTPAIDGYKWIGRNRSPDRRRHQRSFSPEIRNDLTRDAQHDERGLPGFVDGR